MNEVVAVVPAAGYGSRMGLPTPKQYLPLDGSTVLGCSVQRLFDVEAINRVMLVVSDESLLPVEFLDDPRVCIAHGGATRAESVINGLVSLRDTQSYSGNVLVHDAARPCVRVSDIEALIAAVSNTDDGGLLAIPVHDTIKKSNDKQRVSKTIDRDGLWRAATPQLFNLELLIEALGHAAQRNLGVTDEASAMECSGYQPVLVRCATDNIKVTEMADLKLAQFIRTMQSDE